MTTWLMEPIAESEFLTCTELSLESSRSYEASSLCLTLSPISVVELTLPWYYLDSHVLLCDRG